MKTWGSALFPLSVMLTLAGLTFWLRYATDFSDSLTDGKHRHDPDYIVSDSKLSKFDTTGKLKYILVSKEIRHFPDDDSTLVEQPYLTAFDPKKPPITVSAEHGTVSRDASQVDLEKKVRIVRAASAKDEEMTAATEQLTVLPDDDKAFTKEPVLITKGQGSWLKGVGLRVDTRERTYVLESQASAVLQSKQAKKKP